MVTEGGDVIGHSIQVKNKKNKLGPPLREGEFFINYTKGLDTVKTMMSMLKDRKMYVKKGQKYTLTINDESMEYDTVAAIKEALGDKEFQAKVYTALMSKYIGTLEGEDPVDNQDERLPDDIDNTF